MQHMQLFSIQTTTFTVVINIINNYDPDAEFISNYL